MEKIKNTKTYLQTSIIRLEQLSIQRKVITKAIADIKKDIAKNKHMKKDNYDFTNELYTYALQVIKKMSKVIDIEKMKEDGIYDKYKTKDKESVTYHILKIDNKELSNNVSEEQKKQLNYQMLYSKLEQAICETKAEYPNSEVTSFLMNKVETYLAEIQTILRGN